LEWGDKEDFLWEVYAQKEIEPEALASKPYLPDFLTMYIEAFSHLSAQRRISAEGHDPIQLSEIMIYASEFEIDLDDRSIFIRHVCVMDRAYRKYFLKRAKKSG
jgi:hypothetical protein